MIFTLILSLFLGASSVTSGKALSHSGQDSVRKAVSLSAVSPDTLVSQVIQALNAKDTLRLYELSFNQQEFLDVYPHFETDTSESRREFANRYYLYDNRKTLQRRMDEEAGHGVTLSRYEIEGPLETYGPMILYKGFRIWVKQGGKEKELHLIKSAAKYHDGWKIWSFTDE